MAIDTSIYQNLLRPPKSVAEYDDEAAARQMNRLALQGAQAKAAEDQRAIAAEAALSQALASGGDVQNQLARGGFGSKALAYAKSQQDLARTAADVAHLGAQTSDLTQKTKTSAYDLQRKQHDLALQEITSFSSPADAVASLDAHIKRGEMSPEEGAAMRQSIPTDPKAFRNWQIQTVSGLLDAKERMTYIAPTANTVANNATSRANNASNNFVQMRGQNLTDARARESNGAARIPAGYKVNSDGTMSFIPGGPADPAATGGKAPTEFQGKSAGFGARAEQADKIIAGLTGKYSPARINAKMAAESTPLIGGLAGAGANSLLSGNEQKAEQAQRDFINSILRQESGAAIGASEFDNARKQYFPQPGDGDDVISQKAANRKLAVQGLKNSAGKAAFEAPTTAPSAPALPKGWSVERN